MFEATVVSWRVSLSPECETRVRLLQDGQHGVFRAVDVVARGVTVFGRSAVLSREVNGRGPRGVASALCVSVGVLDLMPPVGCSVAEVIS